LAKWVGPEVGTYLGGESAKAQRNAGYCALASMVPRIGDPRTWRTFVWCTVGAPRIGVRMMSTGKVRVTE